jgi:hypothetical protein
MKRVFDRYGTRSRPFEARSWQKARRLPPRHAFQSGDLCFVFLQEIGCADVVLEGASFVLRDPYEFGYYAGTRATLGTRRGGRARGLWEESPAKLKSAESSVIEAFEDQVSTPLEQQDTHLRLFSPVEIHGLKSERQRSS